MTRDLTERKIAEDRLKEYSNRLEFQNRELEQFAYAASHDMKEPLRKIHLYHSFIAENPNNLLDDKSKDYLERAANSIRRMKTLIEDLLAYSRATSDAQGFTLVDLNEIVNEVIDGYQEEIEQGIISIEKGRLPIIRGIPFQCKQLMENLVENAIKYRASSRQSIIRIVSENVDQTLHGSTNTRYEKVSIIDNGIGFDPKYGEKIFELFQRLNVSNGTRGSGIGLAICRKIVQHHGGIIKATGEPGAGARFDIYFPV